MTVLFQPPQVVELPLSKGNDLYFSLRYKPLVVDGDGAPVLDGNGQRQYVEADYPEGASVQLVIENDSETAPIVVQAVIHESLATVWLDKDIADTVKTRRLWRASIAYANGLDQVMCNGRTARYDGGR